MHQGEGQVGQLPHQILADQKAPPGSGGAPHYCRITTCPTGFLTLGASLLHSYREFLSSLTREKEHWYINY